MDLKKDDPRVVAAVEWARRHFTVSENPGMGAAGHFYYLLALTKALDVHGTREIVLESGGIVDWRRAVILELIQRQQADGSWVNTDSARWMERDPVLVTAYSILALSRASGGL